MTPVSIKTPATILLSLLPLLLLPSAAGAAPRFFTSDSVWNTSVSAQTTLDPSSASLVSSLVNMTSTYGASLDVTTWSTPIYVVPADQPTVFVHLTPNPNTGQVNPDLQSALSAVPIPNGAQPASGTDELMVIYQPSTNTMWEFWHAQLESDGWHCDYGGRIVNVSTNPGYYQPITAADGSVLEQPWWGASATSLPLADSIITIRDLQNGYINHALALDIPHDWVRAGVMAWPAERSDGISTDPASIPEGAHFRLDPTLNIDSLNLPPLTRMIAIAAQRYGFIVRDGSSNVTIDGQSPRTSAQTTAWQNIMAASGFQYWCQVLKSFPWSSLQLLPMTLSPYGG